MDFVRAECFAEEAKNALDGVLKSLERGDSSEARSYLASAQGQLEWLRAELDGQPGPLRLALALVRTPSSVFGDGRSSLVVSFEGPSLSRQEFPGAWDRWVLEAKAAPTSPSVLYVSGGRVKSGDPETLVDMSYDEARKTCERAFLDGGWTQRHGSPVWNSVVQIPTENLARG